MSNIKQLVANGELKAAIQLIINHPNLKYSHPAIALMARLTRISEENSKGTISHQNYTVERNRISLACLEYAKFAGLLGDDTPLTTYHTQPGVEIPSLSEQKLLSIINENSRRRPEIADEARGVLQRYREWMDEKHTKPTFDPANRRFAVIKQEFEALVSKLDNEQQNALELIVARIAELLKDPVPTYDQLSDAYTLALGRGFKSDFIEAQLHYRPNDAETKITIAERIEAFTLQIKPK